MAQSEPRWPLDHDPDTVRKLRIRAGLTMTELARRCERSLSFVSDIESGWRNPGPATMTALAAGLGCEVADLERKPTPAEQGFVLTRELWEVVRDALGSDDPMAREEALDLLVRDAPLSWTDGHDD